MEVKMCRLCGHMFKDFGQTDYCPDCAPKVESAIQNIRVFWMDHPNASAEECADHVGIPVKQVKEWIREQKIIAPTEKGSQIFCKVCQAPIQSGHLCTKCKLAFKA